MNEIKIARALDYMLLSTTGGSRYVPGSQPATAFPRVDLTFQSGGQGADPFTGTVYVSV